MKKFAVIALVICMTFLVTACERNEKPKVLDPDTNGLWIISKNSRFTMDAVNAMKGNIVYFRDGKRCFAAIMSRVKGQYAVASFTQIDCEEYK